MTVFHRAVPSPIGPIWLSGDGETLTRVSFSGSAPPGPSDDAAFPDAFDQLSRYLAGERVVFDLPLAPEGTDFQRRVWAALREIPYGATESYGGLALRLGDPRCVRAVGRANGKNPLAIVVPCHRVIGAKGDLVGFGGGLDRKLWLLQREGAQIAMFAAGPRVKVDVGAA